MKYWWPPTKSLPRPMISRPYLSSGKKPLHPNDGSRGSEAFLPLAPLRHRPHRKGPFGRLIPHVQVRCLNPALSRSVPGNPPPHEPAPAPAPLPTIASTSVPDPALATSPRPEGTAPPGHRSRLLCGVPPCTGAIPGRENHTPRNRHTPPALP